MCERENMRKMEKNRSIDRIAFIELKAGKSRHRRRGRVFFFDSFIIISIECANTSDTNGTRWTWWTHACTLSYSESANKGIMNMRSKHENQVKKKHCIRLDILQEIYRYCSECHLRSLMRMGNSFFSCKYTHTLGYLLPELPPEMLIVLSCNGRQKKNCQQFSKSFFCICTHVRWHLLTLCSFPSLSLTSWTNHFYYWK